MLGVMLLPTRPERCGPPQVPYSPVTSTLAYAQPCVMCSCTPLPTTTLRPTHHVPMSHLSYNHMQCALCPLPAVLPQLHASQRVHAKHVTLHYVCVPTTDVVSYHDLNRLCALCPLVPLVAPGGDQHARITNSVHSHDLNRLRTVPLAPPGGDQHARMARQLASELESFLEATGADDEQLRDVRDLVAQHHSALGLGQQGPGSPLPEQGQGPQQEGGAVSARASMVHRPLARGAWHGR